ncbi:bile acid:sodium symporter family protein [Alicyclobacillus fodiniaquatilis]|jgi:BASS family bile acid:Na+ symporter|uniref:Bile acid:sodium symporter family protein n=1 Tax=Alicyclobacillus fodiniaquatilis TaxID=1661150 RepID=A0ABW4JNI4_9BACL
MRLLTFVIAKLMPLWIVVVSLIAFHWSRTFISWSGISDDALGFVLFMMGMTLERQRLKQFLKRPIPPLLGSLGHWIIAPGVSVLLAWLFFGLHTQLANGIIMNGVVPSGSSSNLNTLVANGDLSLSVCMSGIDTLIAPLLTPALSKLFAGQGVHLAYLPFVLKTARIVFLPLVCGILLQIVAPKIQTWVRPMSSMLSALALYVVVIGIVAPASASVSAHAAILVPIFVCVILQILLQMGAGGLYARLLKFDSSTLRSELFEVGICNTALAAVLATDAFGPLAGVACMINVVCCLVIGSFAAVFLSRIPLRPSKSGQSSVLAGQSISDGDFVASPDNI